VTQVRKYKLRGIPNISKADAIMNARYVPEGLILLFRLKGKNTIKPPNKMNHETTPTQLPEKKV
jgi:hypothetical protein